MMKAGRAARSAAFLVAVAVLTTIAWLLPARAELNASCCGKWLKLTEGGEGYVRHFDCKKYMEQGSPAARREVCRLLTAQNAVCKDVAQYCSSTGPAKSPCDECSKDQQCDLTKLRDWLLQKSKTFSAAYTGWRRRIPKGVTQLVVDPNLDEAAGGGRTTGHPGETDRTIIINPGTVCEKHRDLVEVFVHEWGHVLVWPVREAKTNPDDSYDNSAEEALVVAFTKKVLGDLPPHPASTWCH